MTNEIENGLHYQWDHKTNTLTVTIQHTVNTTPNHDGSTNRHELIDALTDIRDMIDECIDTELDYIHR